MPGDEHHESVDVPIPLYDVVGKLLVMLAECAHCVGKHRFRDIEDPIDGLSNREVFDVHEGVENDELLGLLEDLEAEKPLRDFTDHPPLLRTDAITANRDDAVAAVVA